MTNNIKTGYEIFDQTGLNKQTLHLFTGKAMVGKSMLLQNFAYNAYKNGSNVLYISLDISEDLILKKFIKLSDNNDVDDNNDNNSKLILKSENNITIENLKESILNTQEIKNINIDFLVLDYFNLLNNENNNITIQENYKNNIEGLKLLAQEMNICILSALQISSTLAKSHNFQSIDQIADSIWSIEQTTEQKQKNCCDLKHLKCRYGKLNDGLVFTLYDKETLKIKPDNMIHIFKLSSKYVR